MNSYKPLEKANLPQNKVCHVVVSGEYPLFLKELECNGVTTIITQSCPDIMPQVANHADMLFSHLGKGRYFIEKSQSYLKSILDKIGFVCENDIIELSVDYPADSLLNAALFDKRLICGRQSVTVYNDYVDDLVTVKQGYTKCSICPVDERSMITDDKSVHDVCAALGFDVLLVNKGSVVLNGFDYGFIGGCCGKLADDILAFCGDLRTHSDWRQIDSFIRERGVFPLNLSSDYLTDIGSILPITEFTE